MNKLYVDSVMKAFGNNQVLTDIFISCEPGEIVGLLGRNGTGKSTLLKIIFGSLHADRKFIRIDDRLINGLFDNRKYVKYLPQDSFLPNHLKVKSIIALFCSKQNAKLVMKHELILPMLNKRSNQLSGGEKRLLEIWLIVYSNAKYILIDEPYNGVAPVHVEEIKRIIKEQSKHKGFIITDHDYRNIIEISTRTIVIHDGGTIEVKNIDELKYWGYIPVNAGQINTKSHHA